MERYPFAPPQWVATPPPGALPAAPPRRRARYTGPPVYASPPRWGFPALSWRWPTSVPGTRMRPPATVESVRSLARQSGTVLWMLTAAALLAAGGEVWRYVLLVRSRDQALGRGVVSASDALVIASAVLTIAFTLVGAFLTVWWVLQARAVAADLAGQEPSRPGWQVVLGLLVPGINLVVPGAVLAELEHAVLRRPVTERPRPSGLVLAWWLVWAASGLLFAATLLWRLRGGVQAQADGVLLNTAAYLAAATVAVLTARVVRRLTVLLAPVDPASVRLLRVIRVDGAPDPPLRPGRPPGSAR
ncbi:MAG TPA: DUF4328 domain-containing protein [Actinophytocola sp.]|uniref:DUF4328 domain-containing protein n=1 Tax=Actinophytocola sp. TaxID=1872138 RepID=UPI002DBF7337|nr:DUF4328 domain-containing protein [Actinophytocola sp.]HEU5473211.1 DUF4328 domain-containing protein [Actinophytocola sp.]